MATQPARQPRYRKPGNEPGSEGRLQMGKLDIKDAKNAVAA